MTLITNPLPSALRDPDGVFIPPGSVHKTYGYNPMFDDEPIPSWMTSPSGTSITPTTGGSPYGGFEVVNPSIPSQVAFGPDVPRTPYLVASALTLRGVRSMSATGGGANQGGLHSVALRLSTGADDNADRGASLVAIGFSAPSSPVESPSASTQLRAFYDGNLISNPSLHRFYDSTNGGRFTGATMCLLVHWTMGMVYAFEGDFETGDCVNTVAAPGILRYTDENPIRPRMTVSHRGASGTAVAAPLRVAAVQVDHWYF